MTHYLQPEHSSPVITKSASWYSTTNTQSISSSSSCSIQEEPTISSFNDTPTHSIPNTTTETPSKINIIKQCPRNHTLPCFALNLWTKYGNILPIENNDCFYLLKFQKVNIEDNFNELYEQGRSKIGNYYKQKQSSIPEISFWHQRYYYYSKFDNGIQMDYESWYSVTPEAIAKYIAVISRGKAIIDGFCGSGGNVIQFSKYGKMVYAIDIDEKKIEICKNNCKVYECSDNIEFIRNDYLNMKNKISADYVFLSPPWGGIKYKDSDIYSIKQLMTPDIWDIVRISLSIAKNIFFYVPRNLDLDEWMDIMTTIKNEIEPGSGNKLCFDVRILHSNGKIKALLIIFGNSITINTLINEANIREYWAFNYDIVNEENINYVNRFSKWIGYYRFLKNDLFYRKNVSQGPNINYMIKYFFKNVLTEQERLRWSALTIKTFASQQQKFRAQKKREKIKGNVKNWNFRKKNKINNNNNNNTSDNEGSDDGCDYRG